MEFKTTLVSRIESSAIFGSIGLVLLFVIGTKGLWLKNLPDVLLLTSQIGIVAIGQALLMISGEFDLSVGSVFAFVGLVFASLMQLGLGVIPSFLCAILISTTIGLMNGLIISKFKISSLIVTLGALFIYRGFVYILAGGYGLPIPPNLRDSLLIHLLGGNPFGFNNSILFLGLITATFMVILSSTRYGNHVFAVGGDAESALSRGVSPAKTKIIAFITCSFLAGLAGIIATCRECIVYSTAGRNSELETIAAAVVGGCSLRGGIGSIWGTILGAFILSSIRGGLIMMGAPPYWYISFVGIVLIIFMIISKKLTRGSYGMSG